jgi:hypothetical protein
MFFEIEAQIRFALLGIRPMAIEADIGEDRPDIAIEFDDLGQGGFGTRRHRRHRLIRPGASSQRRKNGEQD